MNKTLHTAMPLVTIGIPTYKQEAYIEKAVESALGMNYPNLEVIVADDDTGGSTEKLLQKFISDDRFRYIRNKQNLGRTGNYRKLLYEYAYGEWYLNLDGDDYFTDSNFVTDAINSIGRFANQDVVLYQASLFVESISGKRICQTFNIDSAVELLDGKDYFMNYLSYGSTKHLSAMYNRKKAMEIDFYRSQALRSDLESLLRLCLRGSVILQKKPVGVWLDHGANETWLLDENRLQQEMKVYETIALDAEQFLGIKNVARWKRESIEHLNRYYLDNLISKDPSISNLKIFMKRSKWNYVYIKMFFKFLLCYSGLYKKRNSNEN